MNGIEIEEGADVTLNEADLITEIKNDLEFAYHKAKPFLDIMVQLKLEHDNQLNPEHMPTRSKISLPFKFAQVEEALGKYNEHMWPPMNIVKATPTSEDVDLSTAMDVENGLYHMAKDKMKCPVQSLPTLRDSAKVGLGYAIIEPKIDQRLEREVLSQEGSGGKLLGRVTRMSVGDPVSSLRQRYVTPGQVVPYPDGWTTNGEGRASSIFFMDFVSELEFKKLVTELREGAETLDFDIKQLTDQKVEQVISRAKNGNLNNIPAGWFTHIRKLGGIDYQKLTGADRTAQATIPILKTYRENEHVWLVNGDTMIYRQASRAQTFRCPLLRACAVRDGMSWFPYNSAEALRDSNFHRNVWLSLIFDIGMWESNRPLIYSTKHFDEAPEYGPGSNPIPVDTPNARDGAAFLAPPGASAGLFQMGQILDEKSAEIEGRRDYMQKNFVRGGQHAFNDLLNSSRGRERIAMAVLESGFLNDIFEQILIYMQIAGIGFSGNVRTFNERTGTEEMAFLSVDADDFRNSFDLNVSLDSKYMSDEFTVSDRLSLGREFMNIPGADAYEVGRFLVGNDEILHRILGSKDNVAALRQQDRDDQRQATQLGISRARASAPQVPETAGMQQGGAQ